MRIPKGEGWLLASAPGRADFLNTHQDYKGLPVVPVAVRLRTYVSGRMRGDSEFRVASLNLKYSGEPFTDSFHAGSPLLGGGWFGDYFRAVVNVLAKEGYLDDARGAEVWVESEVPIGSGLSSSAALEVAFLTLLNELYSLELSTRYVAELAYLAEHDEMRIPCGRLDQYSSAFGGVILLECRPPFRVERLPPSDLLFVILDSGVRHSTALIHPERQREIDEGLRALMGMNIPAEVKAKLGYRYFEPRWEEISLDELEPHLERISHVAARRILFTLKMQRSTEAAIKIIKGESPSSVDGEVLERARGSRMEALGEVMNYQHELLRDLYEVSHPKLEEIRDAVLKAGAYGAKLSGAGMGGSLIALVSEDTAEQVLRVGVEAGAVRGWISPPGEPAKLH
ncbi:MAG: GHMP kinase [Candidatus Freyarchaeota archaeon]|nr:GHMP kinase [Candidatus Jordarchaeia archaeon]